MQQELMSINISLPHKVFAQIFQVARIVAVTHAGTFGILPHRLDCIASLPSGILVVESQGKAETYIAVNEGVLVKSGLDIMISVRNAISGTELSQLRESVDSEFKNLGEQEKKLRAVLVKMESRFILGNSLFQFDRAC